jgi:hypothetical protein
LGLTARLSRQSPRRLSCRSTGKSIVITLSILNYYEKTLLTIAHGDGVLGGRVYLVAGLLVILVSGGGEEPAKK